MPQQNERVIRTAADEIFELVKKNKKISVEEAAKKLKMAIPVVQALVDFLVEEKVFGIEYKFTTPYIYLYRDGVKEIKEKEKGFTEGLVTKEQFYENVKKRNVPYEKIGSLWMKYLQQNLANIREEFLRKAREKGVSEEKIEELWKKYLSYL